MAAGGLVIRTFLQSDITEPAAARAQAGEESPSDHLPGRAELTRKEMAEIVRRDVFGHEHPCVGGTTTDVQDSVEPAEPAEKHLELQGTIAGPAEVAMAIIKDRQKNMTDLYKIGDAVGGACIVSIRKDAVILSKNGLKKILKLDVSRPRSAAVSAKQGSAKSEVKPVPVPPRSVRRIQVLEEILEKAVIEPAVENNQTVGLRIRELDEIPMVKALGLQEGDIIHIVNGQTLSSKQKAFQVFRKAKVQPEILLELTRDGKRETLGFSLR